MQNPRKALGIKWKMILMIVPVVLISLAIVAVVNNRLANSAILEQTDNYLDATLNANVNSIDGKLETIRITAKDLSITVSNGYQHMNIDAFSRTFGNTINSNDLILGSGIWFEPGVYTGDEAHMGETYVGPYWYRDGNVIVEDWEYSNADYDYFNQEYYLQAKSLTTLDAVITDPYYDEASNSVMASCSAPIFNEAGEFIGCITVDISLDTIMEIVNGIKVGKTGYAQMVASDGTYISTQDTSKISKAMKISEDPDPISSIASTVLGADSGMTEYKDSTGKMDTYFGVVPKVNWKLILTMPQKESHASVNAMTRVSVIISVIAIIASIVVIFLIAHAIAASILKVYDFAEELSSGNFTINELEITRADELGDMSVALNEMYRNNSGIIRNISEESGNINDSASTLSAMSEELSAEFANIRTNMSAVNDAMMSSGAATEEVSASVAEVNTSVEELAKETEATAVRVREITARAREIEKKNQEAHDNAIEITEARREELKNATAQAKVVDKIADLADSIAAVADQIDLLSLNASIEAARAGEAGRGFAVVAGEINKLATETAETVGEIQNTIGNITKAFGQLSSSSNKLLEFVTDTVTPDYSNFVNVGRQYGEDAQLFGDLAGRIEEMTENIKNSMKEVNYAVASIAESTQDTSAHSAEITDSVESVSSAVDSVADLAMKQQVTAGNLTDIVNNFKLG